MKYKYSYGNDYWHIMIPVSSKFENEKHVIASCTDSSIIKLPVPGRLNRHVKYINSNSKTKLDNFKIKLKYNLICPDCLKLYNEEEIKFNLIVYKLKGKEK